jgi:hypothetical protein
MDAKPTIEQFVSDYLGERTVTLKMIVQVRRPYRERFYDGDCLWDSRRGVVESSESEKVISVSVSGKEATVITTGSALNYRSRYHVNLLDENSSIQEVDTECYDCHRSGISAECAKCGGSGWLSWKDRSKWSGEGAFQLQRPTVGDPVKEEGLRDPSVEKFMTDHFRERTMTLRREREIYSEHAKRFFRPGFDWNRWVGSIQNSEAERIVSMALADTGAQVITRGFSVTRLRYNLQRTGADWLIKQVDTECLNCLRKGKRDDCFWCGGTIWGRKRK